MANPPKPGPPGKEPTQAVITTEDVPAVTADDAAEMVAAPVVPAPPALNRGGELKRQRIVVSQGVFEDLARLRKVTDPGSGHELRVGNGGKVAAFHRGTGLPADVDVVCPPVPEA